MHARLRRAIGPAAILVTQPNGDILLSGSVNPIPLRFGGNGTYTWGSELIPEDVS